MGADFSYKEAGKHHADTIAYNDEDVLTSIFGGNHPEHISQIRVWYSQYIVGFEAFYDGVSAGARMGSSHAGVAYVDFVLSPGEYINEVHGRSGDVIDMLGFNTTFGRNQTFGTSPGGTPFSLSSPGKVVKGFRVGFGGHLHYVGAQFGYPAGAAAPGFPAPTPVAPTPAYPGATPAYPAATPGYPAPTPGFPAPAPAFPASTPGFPAPTPGFPAPVPAPGAGGVPTYTPPGGAPTYMPPGGTPTYIPPGGTPTYIPPGGAMPTPIPAPVPVPAPSPFPTPSPGGYVPAPTPAAPGYPGAAPGYPAPVAFAPTQTNVAGKNHPDSVAFNDYTSYLQGRSTVRVSKVRVLHSHEYVYGFETIYEADGVQVSGGSHIGREFPFGAQNAEVTLMPGETITSVSGRGGDFIDNITIQTSLGKVYTFGGPGGSPFSLYVPAGKTIIAFGGSTGGHLHSLFCYYA